MHLKKWNKSLAVLALLVSGTLHAASTPAVEAKMAWW